MLPDNIALRFHCLLGQMWRPATSRTHLWRDLVHLVLLFKHVDLLVLENIWDRVTPFVFPN
jgi:hypothetical protein